VPQPPPAVELLYFVGCPAYRRARERTLRAMAEAGLKAHLTMTRVRSDREAAALAFPGSPTVRVNGNDVDPEGAARMGNAGLVSREYAWNGKREDVPPEELLRRAIAAASGAALQ
jgi:hypothetical protein